MNHLNGLQIKAVLVNIVIELQMSPLSQTSKHTKIHLRGWKFLQDIFLARNWFWNRYFMTAVGWSGSLRTITRFNNVPAQYRRSWWNVAVFHNVAAAQFIVTAACRVASSSSLTCAQDYYISLQFFNYENLKETHQSSYFTVKFKIFLILLGYQSKIRIERINNEKPVSCWTLMMTTRIK